ncbi:NUDIX hydrolase [Microbacterium sp. M]|uniref:NUDIX hydrolase n=1 Tax=Microbacterium sp. M TaxID=3377125 RepID=UPI0038646C9C
MPAIRNISVGLSVKDGHVLVLFGRDESIGIDFYRAIGGGIEFGERADEALRREFLEELGVTVEDSQLLAVAENIFTYEGSPGHEIAHIFAVDCASLDALPLDAELHVLDEGSPVRWVPIGGLREGARPLYPSGATEALFALVGAAA